MARQSDGGGSLSDSSQQPGRAQQPGTGDPLAPRDPWAPPPEDAGGVSLAKGDRGNGQGPTPGPVPAGSGVPQPGAVPAGPGAPQPGTVPPPPLAPTGPYDAAGPYAAPYPQQPAGPYQPGPYGGFPPGYGHSHHGPAAPGYGFGYPMAFPRPDNGLGVAALVLGSVGTVLFFTSILAAMIGVLAVIFGAVGRIRASRGQATNGGQALAGLILGIVAVIAGIGFLVVAVLATGHAEDSGSGSTSYALVVDGAPRG